MGFLRGPMKSPQSVEEILIALAIIIVVCALIGGLVCCFMSRRDKQKKKATRGMITENARIGQHITEEQADTLYVLNSSWSKFANEKDKLWHWPRQNKSSMYVEYFRLLNWSRRLRESETAENVKDAHRVLKRIADEMEGHSNMINLKPQTKRKLKDIAELSDNSVAFISTSPV